MRIDNHPVIPDRPPTPSENEFWRRLIAIPVIDPKTTGYADIVHAYRQIQEEFIEVTDAGDFDVLGMKRCMAERLLIAAYGHEQPFDVCRNDWNALVELGFSRIETFCCMAGIYADCCLFNDKFDIGLEVLDMVTTEIRRRLDEPGLTRPAERYYDQQLASIRSQRERLLAYKSSEAEGIAWDEREEAEIAAGRQENEEKRKQELEAPKD